MNRLTTLFIALPFVALSSLAIAQEEVTDAIDDTTDATMEVVEQTHSGMRDAHMASSSLIYDYMLENGDITQAEIDAIYANRETIREELAALKESGDSEALAARIAELREERASNREIMRTYVDENEELKTALQEQRQAMSDLRQEEIAQHQDIRDTLRENQQQFTNDRQAAQHEQGRQMRQESQQTIDDTLEEVAAE